MGRIIALGQTLKEKPVSLEIQATNQSNTSYEEPRRYTTGVECRDWAGQEAGQGRVSSAPLHSDCSNLDKWKDATGGRGCKDPPPTPLREIGN